MSNDKNDERKGDGLIATNRKARRDFHIIETYQCGISLAGPEVKSLRNKHVSIDEAFARTDGAQLTLYAMNIKTYEFSRGDIAPDRPRTLLAHKKEIIEMSRHLEERGTTLIPLRLDFVRGYVKVTLGVARGKKSYDKRQDLKKRDSQREIDRALKSRNR
ncbi:MAG: SsrA-binding protein SmpB [Acidimicrobiia bacterium]